MFSSAELGPQLYTARTMKYSDYIGNQVSDKRKTTSPQHISNRKTGLRTRFWARFTPIMDASCAESRVNGRSCLSLKKNNGKKFQQRHQFKRPSRRCDRRKR